MRCPRRSSTLPKLAQIMGPSSHHLAALDLFRLWSVRWRHLQLRTGSGRVENVRYGLLGLALTTTTTTSQQQYATHLVGYHSSSSVENMHSVYAISKHAVLFPNHFSPLHSSFSYSKIPPTCCRPVQIIGSMGGSTNPGKSGESTVRNVDN